MVNNVKAISLEQIQLACPSRFLMKLEDGTEKQIKHRLSYPFDDSATWWAMILSWPEYEEEFYQDNVSCSDITAAIEILRAAGYDTSEMKVKLMEPEDYPVSGVFGEEEECLL